LSQRESRGAANEAVEVILLKADAPREFARRRRKPPRFQ
jgi:hypothetical protein